MIRLDRDPVRVERSLLDLREGLDPDVAREWLGVVPGSHVKWAEVIPNEKAAQGQPLQPLVLLASTGSGKTTELCLLAEQLKNQGRSVLALEARRAAEFGIMESLDSEERSALSNWSPRQGTLVVLLDAVDELYLARRYLNDLERQLFDAGLLRPNVQFVFSSREDAWGKEERGWLMGVNARLSNCPSLSPATSEEELPAHADPAKLVARGDDNSGTLFEPNVQFRELRLEPLELSHVGEFASHYGLDRAQCDEFTRAVLDFEVFALFHLRPRDVEVLVDYWRVHRRFDTWRDILHSMLRNGYQDRSRTRGRHRFLTLERYLNGMRRIAAVIELSGARYVLRPDSDPVAGEPHAEDLFPDWTPEALEELFSSPLLVRKHGTNTGHGTIAVQIVQGQLGPYLAATWLARVYSFSGMEDAVVRSFIGTPEGHDLPHVPSLRRSIAGWAVGLVPELRKKVLAAAPEVGLRYGDPADVPLGEMRRVIEGLGAGQDSGFFEFASEARLLKSARPELAEVVAKALQRDLPDKTLINLLYLARRGRYVNAVQPVLAIADDGSRDAWVRATAVELVCEVGNEAQRDALLRFVTVEEPLLRAAIYQALVPERLSGQQLIEFLAAEDDGRLVDEFKSKALSLSSAERLALVRLLNARFKVVAERAENDGARPARRGSVRLAFALLMLHAEAAEGPLEPDVLQLIRLLENEQVNHYVPSRDAAALNPFLERTEIWESIWADRLANANYFDSWLKLCPVTEDHLGWLIAKHSRGRCESKKWRVWHQVALFLGQLEEQNSYSRVKARYSMTPGGKKLFQLYEQRKAASEKEAAGRTAESVRKTDELRRKNSEQLRQRQDKIRTGEDAGALGWAYQFFHEPSRTEAHSLRLRQKLDDDLVPIIEEGFIQWWPRSEPQMPSTTQRKNGELWGLVGVGLDIQRGGVTHFDAPMVRTATLLALAELNTIPAWFNDLYQVYPEAVFGVVREAVADQWTAEADRSTCLTRLARVDLIPFRDRLVALVAELLNDASPRGSETLLDATGVLLLASDLPDWLAQRCATEVPGAVKPKWRLAWFRLWCHADPAGAAEWISAQLVQDSSWSEVVLGVCQKLTWDFDGHRPPSCSMFWRFDGLELWVPLLFEVAPVKERVETSGLAIAVPWGPAEYAAELRDICASRLLSNGSVEATFVIWRLTQHPRPAMRDWAKLARKRQLDPAAEAALEQWDVNKILEAERSASRLPLTQAELQDVVVADLSRIEARLRDGDFSYHDLLHKDLSEGAVQKWVASELQLAGRGVYSVVRENELKDDKLTDVTVLRPTVGRIPIELKPVSSKHRYAIPQLEKTIRDQLIGQYMRPGEVTHGVLLLVRLDGKKWQAHSFEQGVAHLQKYADDFLESHGAIVRVCVIDVHRARKVVTRVEKRLRAGYRTMHN